MDLQPQRLNPSRAALLVVDVQNDYCHREGFHGRKGSDLSGVEAMIGNITRLLEQARSCRVPVIFVQTWQDSTTDSEAWLSRSGGKPRDVCLANTWGAELYRLVPENGEAIVYKHRYSAFIRTKLEAILNAKRIETLVVAGISTNVCVESTIRDGFMLDYHMILAEDACAAFSKEAHEMTLYNISHYFGAVAGSDAIIGAWQEIQKGQLA